MLELLHPRTRLRWQQRRTALLAILLLPIALPILSLTVWLDNVGRSRELPRPRRGQWIWPIWWWYGRHLRLYQIDWWMKRGRYP